MLTKQGQAEVIAAEWALEAAGFVWSDYVGVMGGWSRVVGECDQLVTAECIEGGVRWTAGVVRIEDGETMASATFTQHEKALALLAA